MSSSVPLLDVQLARPFAIGTQPCNALAAWFVAALAERALRRPAGAPLPASLLMQQAGSKGGYPMAVTRLFRLCAAAGLQVGWGPATGVAPASLPLRGRSHGPFWLPVAEARRLRFWLGGRSLNLAGVRRHLQATTPPADGPAAELAAAAPAAGASFWFAFLQARQGAEEGLPNRPGGTAAGFGANAGLQALATQPGTSDLQRAWALFALARQARRRDDLLQAADALQQALRSSGTGPQRPGLHTGPNRPATEPAEQARRDAIRGLCHLGLAWCAYQERRYPQAQSWLDRYFKPGSAPCWLHNPRLMAERHNLQALLWRSRLSSGRHARATAGEVARVFTCFEQALLCAIEADSFTLVESVASNLGYSTWLLKVAMAAPEAPAEDGTRVEAIRWLLLSEWYRQRHALAAGSLSNLLSVCRIARGGLPFASRGGHGASDPQPLPPLPLTALRQQLWPLGELLGAAAGSEDWSQVTAALLAEVRAQPQAHGRLETAGVLLEHAWQLCRRPGAARQTGPLLDELRRLTASMNRVDRAFFELEQKALEAAGATPAPPGRPRPAR
ncbi:hypothetical protein [Eleftheria terrae]|uniref:hypothetical protein n=1 Tax=Eleftheria terrae TaxID=1597781 RepID=UPI00263B7614|nr:hypothetical protein [Eleftheria terrae]WKB54674.1 hypothetical protein N7L95_09955 [Eleftheria terrae]